MKEEEETQLKGPRNNSNKIIGENFSNLEKQMPVKAKEANRPGYVSAIRILNLGHLC